MVLIKPPNIVKRLPEPSVVIPARSAMPGVEKSRPGQLIGCRHQAACSDYSCKHSKPTSEPSVIPIRPNSAVTQVLRARLRQPDQSKIIEDWVSSVIGEDDRSRIFGLTAVSRAKRGLNVEHHDTTNMLHDGELKLDGGQLKAFIRTGQSKGREMYTLAHELGHAALYAMDSRFDQSTPGVEKICNLFAAELTMPTRLVCDIWRETPDAESIAALAKKTRASLSASCVRLAEHLRNATTGLASCDGVIVRQYNANLMPDLQDSFLFTHLRALDGKSTWILPNGLTVNIYVMKKRIVFLARRTG
jgi:hypothetical protein